MQIKNFSKNNSLGFKQTKLDVKYTHTHKQKAYPILSKPTWHKKKVEHPYITNMPFFFFANQTVRTYVELVRTYVIKLANPLTKHILFVIG